MAERDGIRDLWSMLVLDVLVLGMGWTGTGVANFGGMESIEGFIDRLPKVELHVHLVGSASVPTVLELVRRHPGGPGAAGVPSSS